MNENSVDVIYDTVGVTGSAQECMRPLKSGGSFVTIAGDLAPKPKQGVKQQFIEHWPKNVSLLKVHGYAQFLLSVYYFPCAFFSWILFWKGRWLVFLLFCCSVYPFSF